MKSPIKTTFEDRFKTMDDPELKRYFALKRVLITGASSGIGRACAFWLLNQGARVALVGREKELLDDIGEQFPNQAVTVKCDFAIDMQQFDLVSSVVEAFGGIDILINAAGLIFENDVESTFPQDHDYLIDLNLRAVFHITSMCGPFLLKSKGCVVNFSSEWGNRPQQGMTSYCMTKAGVEMLTKCLAMELAPVRVNAVAPGLTRTHIFDYLGMTKSDQQWVYNRVSETTPLKRSADPDDVAKLVVFLCSSLASRITGQVIKVDGGRNLTSSLFTHWESSASMSSKIFPKSTGRKSEENERRTRIERSGPINVKAMLEKSRWYTDMADAHVKIKSEYMKEEFEFDPIEVREEDEEDNE